MVFMILLLLLLSGYVAVSVIASYWLLLAIGVSALSLAGLLFWVDHDIGAGPNTNSGAEVSGSDQHQRN